MMIFLSYAKEDGNTVNELYFRLKAAGYQPWMDRHDIAAGRNWKLAIQNAQLRCDIGILCLSTRSVSKTGYVQVEVKEFLEQLKKRPTGTIYLIPARLERCPIPAELADQQCLDLFEEDGWNRLITSLQEAETEQLPSELGGEIRGGFSINRKQLVEQWDAPLGYKVQLSYPEFRGRDAATCSELNTFFEAKQRETLHTLRANRVMQNQDGMAKFESITDYHITFVSESALGIIFTNYTGQGRAHGTTLFESYNYLLRPITRLPLSAFFKIESDYLSILGEMARQGLKQRAWERSQSGDFILFESPDEIDLLVKGTTFRDCGPPEFTFSNSGLTLYFPPYKVACYAAGTLEVTLPYYDLRAILRSSGPHEFFIAQSEFRNSSL